MLLYLWVNQYKHIRQTGFNLSSGYEFTFSIISNTSNQIAGKLSCVKKNIPKIFNEKIKDFRAIIGENGAGKSTILEILIQDIMTKPTYGFDGFLLTDKFLFNRNGIDFGKSIENLTGFDIKEVSNHELVNYNRDEFQNKVKPEEVKNSYHGQIATSHLTHVTLIHYSPLMNIDSVVNSEGIAGSSKLWETDYWHYYDYTTENCIINDYNSVLSGGAGYFMAGESELLAYKSAESIRCLEFLASPLFRSIPFKNHIRFLHIRLNDFYQKFWQTAESFFKPDNEQLGIISEVVHTNTDATNEIKSVQKKLESNLYLAFLYGSLKFEYNNRTDFSVESPSNAILETFKLFQSTASSKKSYKAILKVFLKKSQFAGKLNIDLFEKIRGAIDFILQEDKIIKYENDFSIPVTEPQLFKKLVRIFYDGFVLGKDIGKKNLIYHIFTVEFNGLSSGEKSLLSMFGRIAAAAKSIPASQTEVVFLLDEPEVTLHPQWQTSFISLLNDLLPKLFPGKELQIIISSHSPILVSDLPKDNILFLKKDPQTGEGKVSGLMDITNTFGANIHALYADAFFLKEKGGAMGKFAKGIILSVIEELKRELPENPVYLKSIIDLVGEPLIKNQLDDLFYSKFPEQGIEDIDERIRFLEAQLQAANKLKNK